MFGVGAATRVYLAAGTTDLRKSFEGLYGLVRDHLLCDPLSGHVFFVQRQLYFPIALTHDFSYRCEVVASPKCYP